MWAESSGDRGKVGLAPQCFPVGRRGKLQALSACQLRSEGEAAGKVPGKYGQGSGSAPPPSRSPVTPLPGAEGQPSWRKSGGTPCSVGFKPSRLGQEMFFLRCKAAGRHNRGLWVCSRLEYASYSVRKSAICHKGYWKKKSKLQNSLVGQTGFKRMGTSVFFTKEKSLP